jgi:hypothetical protein
MCFERANPPLNMASANWTFCLEPFKQNVALHLAVICIHTGSTLSSKTVWWIYCVWPHAHVFWLMHYNQIKRPRFKIFCRLYACIRFVNELFQKLFIISVAHKRDYGLNMNINLSAARYGQLVLVLKHFLNKYTALSPDFIFAMHPMVHTTQCGSLLSILCVLNSWLFSGALWTNSQLVAKPPYVRQKQTQKSLCVRVFIWGKYLFRCIKHMHIRFSSIFLLTSLLICCILLTFVKCWWFWTRSFFIKHNQCGQHVFRNYLKYTIFAK